MPSPKRRAPRPKGQRLSLDFRGTLLAKRPFGRGARNEVFFLCRCFSRDIGGAIPTGQGPSRPDREKAFNPPQDRAQKKEKRASRGRSPQTVRENNPLPTTNDDRRPQRRSYRRECDKWLGFRGAATMHVPFSPCLNQQCVMRSAEWGGRAGSNTAKQARTLGVLLPITVRYKMTVTIISIEISILNV